MIDFFSQKKGAILVMSLLIGSAITIVGVEVAMFVVSSIKQSRTIDHSTVAYYAAESGVESVMHQVRKENKLTFADLRQKDGTLDGATWSVITGVFRDSITELQKAVLVANDSIQSSFYTKNGDTYVAIQNLSSMKITWSSEKCTTQRPSIEMTAIEFVAGGGMINWNSKTTQLKKDIQVAPPDDATIKSLYFNFVNDDSTLINKPMIVRVKGLFCDLSGVKLTLFNGLDGGGDQLNIPNYFYINPKGVYAGATRDELKSTFAAQDAASSVFDFVLFSLEHILK